MDLNQNNNRWEEFLVIIGDKFAALNRKWLFALFATFVLIIPLFIFIRLGFFYLFFDGYKGPEFVYNPPGKQALEVVEKKIFELPGNNFYGLVRVKNINLEWGVPKQEYSVQYQTLGGTTVASFAAVTYILPASEKIIVLPRFSAEKKPDVLNFNLSETKFVRKPQVVVNLETSRLNIQNQNASLLVTAVVKNLIPFTIRQIDLPVVLYNNKNEMVGANFTNVNTVSASETRSLQYFWPIMVEGAIRAEVIPEANIFDRNLYSSSTSAPPPVNY